MISGFGLVSGLAGGLDPWLNRSYFLERQNFEIVVMKKQVVKDKAKDRKTTPERRLCIGLKFNVAHMLSTGSLRFSTLSLPPCIMA